MMKKTKMVLVCTLLCCLFAMNVYASEIMPCADDYFISATAFLANNKTLVIDCVTYDVYDQIAVTRVWVERLVRGEWTYVSDLTTPSYVATDAFDYGAEMDYSNEIGIGTVRVGFTVDADGYSISRYSNSRTY